MYKELFSTDRVGVFIDLDEWGFGIELSRNLYNSYTNTNTLLEFHLLCLHISIAW